MPSHQSITIRQDGLTGTGFTGDFDARDFDARDFAVSTIGSKSLTVRQAYPKSITVVVFDA